MLQRTLCNSLLITRIFNHRLPVILLHNSLKTSIAAQKSDPGKNEWKDGAVIYSKSEAGRHSVNRLIGFSESSGTSLRPLVTGTITFIMVIYFMFIYDGERNDFFDVDMNQFKSGQALDLSRYAENKKSKE